MKKNRIFIICWAVVAVAVVAAVISLSSGRKMSVPGVSSEKSIPATADAQTSEEAAAPRKMLEAMNEAAAYEKPSASASGEFFADGSNTGIATTDKRRLSVPVVSENGILYVSVPDRTRVEYTGSLDTLIISECSGIFEFKGKAAKLFVSSEAAQVDITGETQSLFIDGKNAVVQLHSTVPENIIITNSTATLVNSTDSDAIVCLSNGSRIIVGARQTLTMSDGMVADHK